MRTEYIEYKDGDTTLEAFVTYQETELKKPAVLVAHDWTGRNQFAMDKAEALADLGYVGVAIDMYGKGKLGCNHEENNALMTPFIEDRAKLRKRIKAGLDITLTHPQVDPGNIGAIGFCFGGLCVLDLARSGVDIRGAVSFHGLLNAPEQLANENIKAKILTLHGHDDPMVNPEQVLAFQTEMTEANVDWQVHN